ncbi:MAG: phage protease [Rhodocyclaceae bacterium]|jgi:phage I-like protein|nr:phage protease [Rhodocyclaceae bacterium]
MTSPQLAALAVKLPSAGNTLQLLPAGEFRARDGRPQNLPAWKMDRASAGRIIAALEAAKTKVPIDYEHQGLKARDNGQPAPAAGWFKRAEWREGEGLYATDVAWTEKARAMIQGGEYLYLSPVIAFDGETGAITGLMGAALTNNPALDGLEEVTALTRDVTGGPVAALRSLLEGLHDPGALKLADQVEALVLTAQQALEQLREQVAETSRAQAQVSELSSQIHDQRIDALVDAASREGRLLPYQVAAARKVAQTDLEALATLLNRPALLNLEMQTDAIRRKGKTLGVAAVAALTQEELHVCALTGRTPQEFAHLKAGFADEETGLTD